MSRWDITEEYVMKKILVLMSLIVVVLFSACKPEPEPTPEPTPEPEPEELGGVYNPEKKISRIYEDDGDGDGKMLREVWRWNNDVLQSIDYYIYGQRDHTEEFSYNDNGQVERIDIFSENVYIEYKYDGSKLSTATYYASGSMTIEYNFTYKDDIISEIKIMNFGGKINDSYLMKGRHNPIKIIFRENDCQAIQKIITNLGNRGEVLMKLSWKDNNVSKIDLTSGSYRRIAECKYDDKSNPFKNYYDLYDADVDFLEGVAEVGSYYTFSTNNITEVRCTTTDEDGETYTDVVKYSYSYEGGFPTVQRYTYSYEEYDWYEDEYDTVTETVSTYYEYE